MQDRFEKGKSAYLEGVEAFADGMSVKQLPYHKMSDNGISWLRGWHTAKYGKTLSEKFL